MPMFLTDDQAVLRDTVEPFMAEQAPISHLRALRDSKDATGFARELWAHFAEMGFNGILVDEADGGLGMGHVEAGIVLEEIGRNLTPSPFLSTAVGAVTALKVGSAEQRGHWLPGILAGTTVAALAVDEGAKHRPGHISLKAERDGNGFKLTGSKTFVAHGHVADLVIVAARTAGATNETSGITLFAVEKGAANLEATPERLADSSLASRLAFDGVHVDADAVIGEVDGGWDGLTQILNAVRTGAASEMLGVGNGAMTMTMSYLKERKQFGKIIGTFQALQHRAAHLYSELEVARAATLKAQQLLDAGDAAAERAVIVAKAMTGFATQLAVQESIQMHGGIGMTDAYDVGLFIKRQRVLGELFGDSDYHANELARLSGY